MPRVKVSPQRLLIALTMLFAVLGSGGAARMAGLGPMRWTPQLIVPSWRASAGAGAWTPGGSMITARMSHTATLLKDGRVLVTGGIGGPHATTLTSAELYDPRTRHWTPTGQMVQPRSDHAAVLLPTGKVLVLGGADATTDYAPVNLSAKIYDPRSGHWSPARSPIAANTNSYFTATLLPSGKVLVAGGSSDFSVQMIGGSASALLYDPSSDRWTTTGRMTGPRIGHTATLLPNGKVLMAGGEEGCDQKGGACLGLSSAELYNPRTGTWTATGAMATGRTNHVAVLLRSGKVLVVGGCADSESNFPPRDGCSLSSAEQYDPRTGTWAAAGHMASPLNLPTATVLPSGQVLVVGDAGASPFNAEVYEPRTGRWMPGHMTTRRSGQTETLLADGRVLVTGGADPDSGQTTSSTEIYTPPSHPRSP